MEFYGNRSIVALKECIDQAKSPTAGIKNFFKALIKKTQDKTDVGCLVVNTLLEMSSHNATIQSHANKHLNAVETELCKALEKAKALNELAPDVEPKTLAKYLMINIWGLRVLAKTGTINSQTQSHYKDQVLAQILVFFK